MTKSLIELQQNVQADDWETARGAAAELAAYGSAALPVLLPLLQSQSGQTRNAVALALRDIADNRAVEPLVQAIRNPLTAGNRGTLVYALETHDCSDYFLFLFGLTLSDSIEVQNHALTILYEQSFWFTCADLDTAQSQLDAYIQRPERRVESDVLIRDLHALLADLRQQAQT